ncbi:AraC family transcriptional regulator [Altericroceibacterium endophyticum]|uniref:Helix-turn-helix domain-containing protein n=1 Tax=Altericroceibacterium endophyticum TaxID=1808508 RepID=A0A6I4T4V4_9SPHN|nr:AraC family transcriptional regulator [Altericroceibacterium endophyticum]MXO65429.1 helix-turn-helix domain-containing protein [Altericroceibacterium endophyticum]
MTAVPDLPPLAKLASPLAPQHGYNSTPLPGLRILRSEAMLDDVPVLYRPGAVFVLQGAKQGVLDGQVLRYDVDHYLAVSVPVPFRMTSQASAEHPLLALYFDFDLQLAAEIVSALDRRVGTRPAERARSLVSSPTEPAIAQLLDRLLRALAQPDELAILGPGLLRELHYRVLVGQQGGALMAALRGDGATTRLVNSLNLIRRRYAEPLTIADLAREAGMSAPSYHAGFKALTGSTPIQYIKAIRLHEARWMIAMRTGPIASIATRVGYASAAHFSRDFKRHFDRNPSEEAEWMRHHLGELATERKPSG